MTHISKVNIERFFEHVVPITEVIEKQGAFFWLGFGTLLGAVRDKGIFDWEHDFDICVWEVDREKIFEAGQILQKKGYKINFQKNLPWFEDLMQVYVPRENLDTDSKGRIREGIDHVDVYVFSRIGDRACMRQLHEPRTSKLNGMAVYKLFRMMNKLDPQHIDIDNRIRGINTKAIMFIVEALPKTILRFISDLVWKVYVSTAKSLWQVVPHEFFSEFSKISLYGIEFNVPKECEKYLEYLYSSNWRTPNSNFGVDDYGGLVTLKLRNSAINHIPVHPVRNLDKYLWE